MADLKATFKRTNVKGIASESDLITPLSAKKMLHEIVLRGKAQIQRMAKGDATIQHDLDRMVDALTQHLIAQSVRSGIAEIFESMAKYGFAEADLFQTGLSQKFIQKQATEKRLSGVSSEFGMFLEEGMFGVGGQAGGSSEIGDLINIKTQEEIELKAIIGSSTNSHRLKIGGMTLKMLKGVDFIERAMRNPRVRDVAAAYKIIMKMQNLFLMEFGIDSAHYERISPKRATLFWELIIKNVLRLIRENEKRQLFEIEWTNPTPDENGNFKSSVMIHLNTRALYNTEKLTQLYLRRHVFFGEGSNKDARRFFGELRESGLARKLSEQIGKKF